jgi:hypothetical protein
MIFAVGYHDLLFVMPIHGVVFFIDFVVGIFDRYVGQFVFH